MSRWLLPLLVASAITIDGAYRLIESNGMPDHGVGEFPNPHNPNSIRPQSYRFRVPLHPVVASSFTKLGMNPFGVAVNGIPFDPSAAEWWNGDRNSGWQYDAMGGGRNLGLDASNAHVQPNGAYHYHGIPSGLIVRLGLLPTAHSPIVGWAGDGFPIYARYGFSDTTGRATAIADLRSSYRKRRGVRPGGPGGEYDGIFVEDWQYVAGAGELDEANGRWCVTPDFPEGTYAYFLTATFPFVPRCWRGTPDDSFRRGPQGPPPGGRGGPPGRGPGGPPPPRFGRP